MARKPQQYESTVEVSSNKVLMSDGSIRWQPCITFFDGENSCEFEAKSFFEKEADLDRFVACLEEIFSGIPAGAAYDA